MKAGWASCVAVVAAIAFVLSAAPAGGMTRVVGESTGTMTPVGLAAYGATYSAIGQRDLSAQAMSPLGLHAYGETYQSMAITYLAGDHQSGIPVQWHDVFTGVGVTLGLILLLGGAIYVTRNAQHRHYGGPTVAH